MPEIRSRRIGVLVDVAGCPNRCRHCWLGNPPNRRVPEETLRWVVDRFRRYVRPGEREPFFGPLMVATWYREPDFAPDYRRLWELEQELSDEGEARRFELLSVWRLARDERYARWACEVGTEVCQITLFGLAANTDHFVRRKGAFRDALLATERLLEAGIAPRYQVFLTRRLVGELEDLVALVRSLDLERRVRGLGREFDVFVNTVGPSGEGLHLEPQRPAADALDAIPPYLAEKTMQHYGEATLEACLGRAEAEWLDELLACEEPCGGYPETLAFMVTPGLGVYANAGEPMDWWRLGNLRSGGVEGVVSCFEGDGTPGLQAKYRVPVAELARAYGRVGGRLLYSRGDLIERWHRLWAERRWREEDTRRGESR